MRVGAAAVGVAFLAAACSGGSKSSAGGGNGFSIQAVASSTIAARTTHIEGTFSSAGDGAPVHGVFSGDADFARDASSVKIEMSGENGGTLEIVVARGTTYVRGPESVFAGKYMELPDAPFGGGSGTPLVMSTVGWGVADPVRALQQLRGLATHVVDLGHTTIRGSDTTHVRMTVPVGVLFGCAKRPTPTSVDLAGSDVCGTHPKVPPSAIDVWVDDASRMVRLETKIDTGSAGAIDSRLDYSRFGEHVDISAPPKSQVIDEKALTNIDEAAAVTVVSGPWRIVASGVAAGVEWSLSSAPAKNAVCLDFATTPPVKLAGSPAVGPTVIRDGRTVPCQDTRLFAATDVTVMSRAVAHSSITALVGRAVVGVHDLVAHFADGSAKNVAIDARTRTFVEVGAPTPELVRLTADTAAGPITCSDVANLFGGASSSPHPTNAPTDSFYLCLRNAEVQKLTKGPQTLPSLPSSITLTKP